MPGNPLITRNDDQNVMRGSPACGGAATPAASSPNRGMEAGRPPIFLSYPTKKEKIMDVALVQRRLGVRADGDFGPVTLAALLRKLGAPAGTAGPLAAGVAAL